MPSMPCWDAVSGRHVDVRRKTSRDVVVRGTALSDLHLWRLAGALDGTYVDVEEPRDMGNGTTLWSLDGANLQAATARSSGVLTTVRDGPYSSASRRRLDVSDNGSPHAVLRNRGYYLREALQGQGIAWAALCLQVEVAHQLGIARIEVHVEANIHAALTNRVGGLQWPKLGFDGPLPEGVLRELSATQRTRLGLSERSLLSHLLATSEGQEYWNRNPIDCVLALDLETMSPATLALLARARSKAACVRTV